MCGGQAQEVTRAGGAAVAKLCCIYVHIVVSTDGDYLWGCEVHWILIVYCCVGICCVGV